MFVFSLVVVCGKCVWFDFGEVVNFVEVYVNGVNCGVVWMLLYCVEIMWVLKDGDNELCVVVMNMWVNWLIGDVDLLEVECVMWMIVKISMKGRLLLKVGLFGLVWLMMEE